MLRTLLALTLLCSPGAVRASAQTPPASKPAIVVAPPDAMQELVLGNGRRAYGRVEQVDGARITFRTTSGEAMEVDEQDVVSVTAATSRGAQGEPRSADPGGTHLFMASTGRALRQGEGYVGAYALVLPYVQVGLTDRISVGAGTPLYTGGVRHPFWVTPKVQVFNGTRTQAAVGAMHFLNIGDVNVGIAYGVVTHGSEDSAVSAGVGVAYYSSDDEHGRAGIVMVGGEHRVSRRVKFVTENYLLPFGGLSMNGVRWHRANFYAEFGVSASIGADFAYVFPMVNVAYRFSAK